MARSQADVTTDLITNILREEASADVMPGQVLRDVAIDAQAVEISNLYSAIDQVTIAQSITNANFMSQQDLNNLLSNFGISRQGATQAIGQVTFYTASLPTQTVTIPAATELGSNVPNSANGEVTFSTNYDVVFDPSIQSTYYNANTGYWELTADITADIGGSAGNVGSYTITSINNVNIPFSVTNQVPTTGGTDQESNQSFAVRALNIMLGSNAGTQNGYEGLALTQTNIVDALVVGPGNVLMTRDGGYGGKVDIWIVPAATGYTSLTSTNEPSLAYTWNLTQSFNNGYIFNFPLLPLAASEPVVILGSTGPSGSIAGVTLFESRNPAPPNTYYVNPSGAGYHYTIFKASDLDTGGSIYANDYILWNPAEMEYLRQFNPSGTPFTGNTLTTNISYSYTEAVTDFQTVLDSPNNQILTADVLAKEAIQIIVNVNMNVNLTADASSTAATTQQTISNIQTAIINQINQLQLGDTVNASDMIIAAGNIQGVASIVISSVNVSVNEPTLFDTTAESITSAQTTANQYFVAGTINIQSVSITNTLV